MSNLVRNATLSISRRRRLGSYLAIDQCDDLTKREEKDYGWRAFSRRKKEPQDMLYPCSSYRRKRAKQRQIFLTTYKLSSVDALARSKSDELKKVAVKVKKAVVSVVSLVLIGSFSCHRRSTVRTSSGLKGCC